MTTDRKDSYIVVAEIHISRRLSLFMCVGVTFVRSRAASGVSQQTMSLLAALITHEFKLYAGPDTTSRSERANELGPNSHIMSRGIHT
ncbi:hypothetical protein EVAR_70995_1 [Eumeta japonica]|uniref:Uncharacterized protein n=1 Tax=Eumeta variegata TaxID=151549 RepID=A0A4C2A9C2_EUMVA|nr:hypothetical protein EVAR_70995_1 [Eumeta japonica]